MSIATGRAMNTTLLQLDFAGRASSQLSGALTPESRKVRLMLIVGAAMLWVVAIALRLYSLQISDFERWKEWALRQHVAEMHVASERGPIYDRNGKMLAISVPAGSIYVRPNLVQDREGTASRLAAALHIDQRQVSLLVSEHRPFVWIKRQVPRAFAERIAAMNMPGIGYMLEARRVYPYNQAASTLIGKVGIDGNGLSGIESIYDKRLHGRHLDQVTGKDALGNFINVSQVDTDGLQMPHGESVRLTLDADLEIIMGQELEAGRETAKAKAAMAVMIDAETGEVLAMSQAPSTNFNNAVSRAKNDLKNLAVETVFEPGSIMKPIVAAAAIEAGVVHENEPINCEHGRLSLGKHTIHDVHPSDTISFHDVVVRSSNIGMTKVGLRLGAERLYDSLRRFGFGELSHLGLPGETRGILRPVEHWARIDIATHSFGQGVAVTPLQVVRAMSAIANGGILPNLQIVAEQDASAAPRRVISERTAAQVRDMLYGVVEDKHGTGKRALISGVRIGGKTGTAQKAKTNGRGYSAGDYIASFVGFADGSPIGVHRKLAMIVMIDEARVPSIYGGTLAAPVFQKIMQRSLSFLATRQELVPSAPSLEVRPFNKELVPAIEHNRIGFTPVAFRQ